MANHYHLKKCLKHLLLTVLMGMQLTGCLPWDESSYTNQIGGSVGDGPVTGATVDVYSASGVLLGSITSDSNATYSMLVTTEDQDYPLRLVARGGTDLVTGSVPDFEMVSVITAPSILNANINPFSTLIVKSAESMSGGLNAANVASANTIVTGSMAFGLNANAVPDPITTTVSNGNVAHIVKSSEALGEMVRRTRDLMAGTGMLASGDSIIDSLAADLSDGVLDGQGGPAADATITAVSNVVSAQVLLEAASNNLKVGGAVATQAIDMSIISTHAGVSGSELTGNVRVTRGLLDQLEASLAAVQVLDQGQAVANIAATASGLPVNVLPGVIAGSLPVSQSGTLDNALALASVATPADIDAVNQAATGGGGNPGPGNNAAPVISGNPGGSVTAGSSYSFQPSASDADGDTLTFSIANKPSWASFNTGTGRLSGTPGDQHAGAYSNIVISVFDGTDMASLSGFAIRVTQAPAVNTPPVISGSAAGSVFSNTSYVFRPSASDSDGDALTFSISGKPSWASFNTGTGRLSGTPADQHAGTYSNIVIRVSDGTDMVSLPGFTIQVVPAPVVNTPPVISGSPGGLVTAGNAYAFQPSATDVDGDPLTFSIVNKPSWASFNTGSGRLGGTPADQHAGIYSNIIIRVSDGTDTVSLPAFTIQVDASLGSFSLGWTAPAARADGTPLSLADIDGYRVYYGPAQGNYTNSVTINNGSATSAVINNIQAGTWYVVMTTIDVDGQESARSGAVAKIAN